MLLKTLVGSALILLLVGCATTETIFVQEPLPLPERPILPTVDSEELVCLSDTVYSNLAERDAALRGHIGRLEGIIQTTH